MKRPRKALRDFPVCLQLAGREVVVVGGGTVAERRVASLLAAGARVVLVAPRGTPALEAHALAGTIRWFRRAYRTGDLASATVVFAATDDFATNRAVAAEARMRGLLVNAADDPEACDFTMPAVARHGHVSVAVSTDGLDPGGAGRLRDTLAQALTDAEAANE